MNLDTDERKPVLLSIHKDVLEKYLETLMHITPQEAREPGSDGRSISLVVGHIMEWERFFIQSFAEILSGADWSQLLSFSGYVDLDGKVLSFESIDDFNAYQAEKQASWSWERMLSLAVHTAKIMYALLSSDDLFPAERLDQTRDIAWNMPDSPRTTIPLGWYFWQIVIEHTIHHYQLDLKHI